MSGINIHAHRIYVSHFFWCIPFLRMGAETSVGEVFRVEKGGQNLTSRLAYKVLHAWSQKLLGIRHNVGNQMPLTYMTGDFIYRPSIVILSMAHSSVCHITVWSQPYLLRNYDWKWIYIREPNVRWLVYRFTYIENGDFPEPWLNYQRAMG